MLPDAVDHDPRRERVLVAGQPVGQFQPAALLGVDLRLRPGTSSTRQEAARDDRAQLLGLAADADLGVADRPWRRARRSATWRRWPPGRSGRSAPLGALFIFCRALACFGLAVGARLSPSRAVREIAWNSARASATAFFACVDLLGRRRRRLPTSAPSRSEQLGVVVVEAAAPHLVAHAGAQVGAAEDAGQGVVVGRRDRVELVVVAAGAARPSGPATTG